MKEIKGDLIELAKGGMFDVIVHGCNCWCAMGKGIAAQIKKEFPAAYNADRATVKGDQGKLGTISEAIIIGNESRSLVVVNAYTQFDYGRWKQLVDYAAVRRAMREVKIRYSGLRIGYPKIGAGLGGGDWAIISTIIDQELADEDHTLVVLEE